MISTMKLGGSLFGCVLLLIGCQSGDINSGQNDPDGGGKTPETSTNPSCPAGTDTDGDGYGQGCSAGPDCNDQDPAIFPGAAEVCDGTDNDCDGTVDNGVTNACGTCDQGCSELGAAPFPLDQQTDPAFVDADGVGLDENGDLILQKNATDNHYMWIANTMDKGRGTLSKIDTLNMKEVARYYTVTCASTNGGSCLDLHGRGLNKNAAHMPSRTAVDFNFDVWVANRAFGFQQSVTKIANDPLDCVDRNKNGQIETSTDLNGDGKIDVNSAEFLGDDDECILFTVAFDDPNMIGRSVCLSPDKGLKPSHAWVATWGASPNTFYRVEGQTGALSGPYPLPAGHQVYGCAVDSKGILWSVDRDHGTLNALNTLSPTQVGPLLKAPASPHTFYGIAVGQDDHVWLGGYGGGRIYRYKPTRTSFDSLAQGVWTTIIQPSVLGMSRGIAPDSRGWVWVAGNNGFIWRVDQNIADGDHNLSTSQDYWQADGGTMCGVGVDIEGNVWGITGVNLASRLDVDAQGNPALAPKSKTNKYVTVGSMPYTYSDFTGYGFRNFTRPLGRYSYRIKPCAEGKQATWSQLSWQATTLLGTSVSARVRAGDSVSTLGSWVGPYQSSPAQLDSSSAMPLAPNPAMILEVEFLLETTQKEISPILHDFSVAYACDKDIG